MAFHEKNMLNTFVEMKRTQMKKSEEKFMKQ